jgi:glutathione synthase/RimK-type ligase-like ATP-grasp enzyme
MSLRKNILLRPEDAWAFGPLAEKLSRHIGCPISADENCFSYVLSKPAHPTIASYNALAGLEIAADKRLIERAFARNGIPRPQTWLLNIEAEVTALVIGEPAGSYLLKYPTACGSVNHYLLHGSFTAKKNWPTPYLVQEYIRQKINRVYRVYCVGGESVGSNVRRFTSDSKSVLVAHALGARYFFDDPVDADGVRIAESAVRAVALENGFCVVDMLKDDQDRWYVLEVGSDGIHNIVDRDYGNDGFDEVLQARIGEHFNARHALACR